jgi:hypothetical protein
MRGWTGAFLWTAQFRPLAEIGGLCQAVYQSMLPAGLRLGLTTEAAGQAFVAEISEAIRQRRGAGMAPLMVSSWKHKPQGKGAGHPTDEIQEPPIEAGQARRSVVLRLRHPAIVARYPPVCAPFSGGPGPRSDTGAGTR